MLLETLLATALAYTGGAIINDEPANMLEGVSGCAAYSTELEQDSCVGRVYWSWEGVKAEMPAPAEEPVYAPASPSDKRSGTFAQPDSVDPVEGHTRVPVVSGNATMDENGEWVEPEWCELTRSDSGHEGPVEHESGEDWSVITDAWSDEQVDRCFG